MKIYLMRHGETKWNKRSKLQGQVDIPLAPKGIEQAEMTSEGMKDIPFDHIFSSPLKRAYKTAQVVRRDRPIEIVRDDRLKEMSFGTSEGKIIGKAPARGSRDTGMDGVKEYLDSVLIRHISVLQSMESIFRMY